jgi:hypothetical protein
MYMGFRGEIFCVLMLAACTQAPRYTAPGGSFTAAFPCAPAYEIALTEDYGDSITRESYTCRMGANRVLRVDELHPVNMDKWLDYWFRTAALWRQTLEIPLVTDRGPSLDEGGNWMVYSNGVTTARVFVADARRRMYILSVVLPAAEAYGPTANQFFESFRIPERFQRVWDKHDGYLPF